MRAFADTQTGGRGFRVSTGVSLRECSVVIIGSTCRICGKDFKCESDVSMHTQWRHSGTMGSLIGGLDHTIYLENVGHKCDVCDIHLETISDLRIHKRLMHKYRPRSRKRPRKETIRVKFKLNGVTTTDINLDRKYLKVLNDLRYFIDVGTQTSDSLEKEKRRDNCAANIDLSLPDHVVDNSRIQCGIRPHKAANRYIVGKFASTKGDTIARSTIMVGRSLVEILNTPNRDAIPGCEKYGDCRDLTSQENTAVTLIKSVTCNVDDKENSRRINERETRNVYCQSEISLDDTEASLICQRDNSDRTTSFKSKQNSWSNESRYYPIKGPNEVAGNRESPELKNSLVDSVQVAIDNENNNFEGTARKKRLPAPLARLDGKESVKTNSNADDDVQEVLRITRGSAQSDINHESPNRTEREMLIQNAISETFMLSAQRQPAIYPEKYNAGLMANFRSSGFPPFTTVTESSYQFLAHAFDKKLGIYLEDLHRYGIRYYNDVQEINNNDLEEYEVYAHQDFFEAWMQAVEPQYASELKPNDNEVAVVLD